MKKSNKLNKLTKKLKYIATMHTGDLLIIAGLTLVNCAVTQLHTSAGMATTGATLIAVGYILNREEA